MCCHSRLTVPLLMSVAAINLYFLYKYSGIEYSIATDTEVIIRKLISLEEKIQELTKG